MGHLQKISETFNSLSIRTKLTATVVGLILLLGIVMGVYMYHIQTGILTRELQEKGYSIAHNLEKNSINPILTDDLMKLQYLIESTRQTEPDVEYVFIQNRKGQVIVHTFENGFPSDLKNVNPSLTEPGIQLLDIDGRYAQDISYPILEGRVGKVHVGLSEVRIRQEIQRSVLVFMGFTALSVLVGSFIAFGIGTIISRPVILLKKSAIEFGKGNFDHRIEISTRDEIGDLIVTFNEMVDRIKSLINDKEKARLKILETRDYLDAIISGSNDGILVMDPLANIEFCNRTILEICSYEKNDLIGKNFLTITADDNHESFLKHWNDIKNDIIHPFEMTINTKLGDSKVFLVSPRSVRMGETEKYVVMLKDITQLKKVDELKDNIISNISHELRTPLTIMKGFIEVALVEEDQGKRIEYLTKSLNAIDRQNQMIEDLIETAVIEERAFEFEKKNFNLKEMVTISVKDLEHKANNLGIKIDINIQNDFYVYSDLRHLAYAMTKLVDNAIKFNREGGTVEIDATSSDDIITVCVKDMGIGIAAEEVDKIFDKFYQVDAASNRKYSGSGIGLTLARHIIEALGGAIWVKSELGKGSTFCFTIPGSEHS